MIQILQRYLFETQQETCCFSLVYNDEFTEELSYKPFEESNKISRSP